MLAIACARDETLQIGDAIHMRVIGQAAECIYVFVEAEWGHPLDSDAGFHASVPGEPGWTSSVLAVPAGTAFALGTVRLRIDLPTDAAPAHVLRPFQLWVDTPQSMAVVRMARMRVQPKRLRTQRAMSIAACRAKQPCASITS